MKKEKAGASYKTIVGGFREGFRSRDETVKLIDNAKLVFVSVHGLGWVKVQRLDLKRLVENNFDRSDYIHTKIQNDGFTVMLDTSKHKVGPRRGRKYSEEEARN